MEMEWVLEQSAEMYIMRGSTKKASSGAADSGSRFESASGIRGVYRVEQVEQ